MYNDEVPTPASFLGYEIGDDLTEHYQMLGYIRELEETAPDRVKLIQIGMSQERRPMYLVVISSPENMQKLESIRETVSKLKDPREISSAEAQEIAKNTPVISWMNYANDGEESAAFEAGIVAAYHFTAAMDDETMNTLKNSIIVINTAHNPDAHQRHVVWMKGMKVGSNGTPDRIAAEHQGDWLMSTSDTHYKLDSNRDGFALSQKESKIVAKEMRHWSPQVWVDYHGEPEEYFFAPYAIPVNPNYPNSVVKWAEVIGRGNASAFDEHSWTYTSREVYDLHYPGYWDSFPAFNGAIGMTYETNGGGDKGFQYYRNDGTIATLKNAIAHHVVATIATAKTAAENSEGLLNDYYNFFKQGMDEVKDEPVKQVAIFSGKQSNDALNLVELLLEHEIEVFVTNDDKTADGVSYLDGSKERRSLLAGTFIVPMNQPNKRLAKVLLERNVGIQKEFLDEALEAYNYNNSVGANAPKKRVGFYDVTAWSLPLTYGLEAYGLTNSVTGNLSQVAVTDLKVSNTASGKKANYAYLFSYSSNDAASLLSKLMMEGYRVSMATEPFEGEGKAYEKGVVVVRVEKNEESLHQRINELASEANVKVEAIDEAWTDNGILMGARSVVSLRKPKVMVLMDEPTRGRSYGAIWFTLEQRYGIEFTAVRVQDFNRADLFEYDVVIMPPGSSSGYKNLIGEGGISKMKEWIRSGGTFIGIEDGATFAIDEDVNLSSSRRLGGVRVDNTPGAILRVNLDTEHFLALGYDEKIPVHVNSGTILTPSLQGANVAVFDDNATVSGFVFEENKTNFPGNAYLIHEPTGRGNVILFAEQPVFRLYWRGLERLFVNSVLLAPSF
tara:strand:- start:172 stop:2691 length:2520 start_codon:yes stop_codon:yes gene_type:complete